MSVEALTWAIRQEVFPSTRKFVLVMLANYCSDTGLAYPSVKTLAAATSLTEETVTGSLNDLLSDGFITDTGKRAGDTKRIRVFRLHEEAWMNTPQNRGIKKTLKEPPAKTARETLNTPEKQGIECPENSQAIPGESPANTRFDRTPIYKEQELEPYCESGAAAPAPPKAEKEKTPKTIEACREFAKEIGMIEEEADAFFHHFESNGWRVSGRAPMKDWRSAMHNWKRNASRFGRNETKTTHGNQPIRTNGQPGGGSARAIYQRPTAAEERNQNIIGADGVLAGIREEAERRRAAAPWHRNKLSTVPGEAVSNG